MMRAVRVTGDRGELPGLAAERTVLAWDRTALALLANGVLLLIRHVRGTGTATVVPGVLALALVVAVAVLGRRRARRLRAPDGRGGAAGRELVVAGVGVVVLGLTVLALLVVAAVRG